MKLLIGTSLGVVVDEKEMKSNPLRDNIPEAPSPEHHPRKASSKVQLSSDGLRHECQRVSLIAGAISESLCVYNQPIDVISAMQWDSTYLEKEKKSLKGIKRCLWLAYHEI